MLPLASMLLKLNLLESNELINDHVNIVCGMSISYKSAFNKGILLRATCHTCY